MRDLIERIRNWRRDHGDLRFGQWVWCVCGGDPFYVEDDEMARRIEEWEVDGNPQGIEGEASGCVTSRSRGEKMLIQGFEFSDGLRDGDVKDILNLILHKVNVKGACRVIGDDGPVTAEVRAFLEKEGKGDFEILPYPRSDTMFFVIGSTSAIDVEAR